MNTDPRSLIVLCGVDGSGKSLLVDRLKAFFQSYGLPATSIHAHTYTTAKTTFNSDEQTVKKYRLFWRLLIPFAFFDNLLTYFLQYRRAKRPGIIISDRYFYDKVVRLLYYKICPRWLAKIYLNSIPKPDHLFFLDVAASVAIKRKGEYNRVEQEKFRKHYLYAAKILKAPVINTGETIDKCISKIVTILDKKL